MAENKLTLAPNFSIAAVDYAGQGNAILGIRDAGKTYTAMKAAEELLDNKIPIIVYDPVGVWKNLKIGTGKHKGYPIVVAGGEGSDIRLNVNNAVDIVRAAMKENVSLVIDLYSPELINKSSWIRIVQETVDLLMYENKECGLRHIFIEEAAEFIPQRLQPQHSKVYASLERLARMGRNARLGYTLINQRAEEVNKAILEISAFSLLHKQVGKNSLKSIQQWMELLQVENVKEIIQSLPALKQGECWVIGMNAKPHKIKISERKTFHPDPKRNKDHDIVIASMQKIDVRSFVEKLNKQLVKPEDKNPDKNLDKKHPVSVDTKKWEAEINQLKEEIKTKNLEITELKNAVSIYEKRGTEVSMVLDQISEYLTDSWQAPDRNIKVPVIGKSVKKSETIVPKNETKQSFPATNHAKTAISSNSGSLNKCPREILKFLTTYPNRSFSKAQVSVATGYSQNSSGFNSAISELNVKGLISKDSKRLMVNGGYNPAVKEALGNFYDAPMAYDARTYINNLTKCEREIYEVLLDHPGNTYTKEELAEATPTKYSITSSGYNSAISKLNVLELITKENGRIRLNPELLEL